jgi:hypothetical protein
LSVYGNPADIYAFLNNLDSTQVSNIKRIYYLLDYHVLTDKESHYTNIDFNSTFDFLWESCGNLNKQKILHAVDNLLKNVSGVYTTIMTDDGAYVYVRPAPYTHATYQEPILFHYESGALENLKKLDLWCKNHEVEIIYFKSIFSRHFVENLDTTSMRIHFEKTLEVVDGVYSLTYIPEYSNDRRYFSDPSHHMDTLTRIEAQILTSPERRQEYFVTSETLPDYLTSLREQVFNSSAMNKSELSAGH